GPVPGVRAGGAGQDKCRQGAAALISRTSLRKARLRRRRPKKSLILLGVSTLREFVTTPTRLCGGVFPRLCVFIPVPARPGDPPVRLLEIPTTSFGAASYPVDRRRTTCLVHEPVHPDIHHDAQSKER